VKLVKNRQRNEDVESLLLANVRSPEKRRADLRAQLGANERAEKRVQELRQSQEHGLNSIFDAVVEYSHERMRAELREIPDGEYHASDVLEGDGVTDDEIPVEATVTVDGGSLTVDFTGTAAQVAGNINAPLAVAKSAVYFVLRCVTDPDIPPNHGCYEPVSVRAPEGSLLNPCPPAAVVGGNVETSQRVTDVVFAALGEAAPDRVPAQGQGTMNNLIVGSSSFTYYETIGGGSGGNPSHDGLSGAQVGMTNTLNTPVEALEGAYPLRVERYALRDGTGGAGQHRGGDGLVRSITVEQPATVSLLTDRRARGPRGVAGGESGAVGRNLIDGDPVPAKVTREVSAGTTVTVETPGGGGYGEQTAEHDQE
jgi:N-methylhydantoinase B